MCGQRSQEGQPAVKVLAEMTTWVRAQSGEAPGLNKGHTPTSHNNEILLRLLFDTIDEQFIQIGETCLKVLSMVFATLNFIKFCPSSMPPEHWVKNIKSLPSPAMKFAFLKLWATQFPVILPEVFAAAGGSLPSTHRLYSYHALE